MLWRPEVRIEYGRQQPLSPRGIVDVDMIEIQFNSLGTRGLQKVRPAENFRHLSSRLQESAPWKHDGIDHHDTGGQVHVAARELKSDGATQAVANNQWSPQSQLAALPCDVVGEPRHCVVLDGGITAAVATEVHCHDTTCPAEIIDLR